MASREVDPQSFREAVEIITQHLLNPEIVGVLSKAGKTVDYEALLRLNRRANNLMTKPSYNTVREPWLFYPYGVSDGHTVIARFLLQEHADLFAGAMTKLVRIRHTKHEAQEKSGHP
jgi:hypothetical protein